MKLLIAVPSKGRANNICKQTLRWVSRTGYDLRVFVEPKELKDYQEAIAMGNHDNYVHVPKSSIISIGANDKGLGYAKGFIHEYAKKHKYDLVFKMDDDIKGFRGRGKKKNDDDMVMEFCAMVGTCRLKMGENPDFGAIGFPYAFELWEPKKWAAVNARLQTAYIVRTELLQGGFNAMEDFAQYVYIRAQNKLTLRYGLLGIDCAKIGTNKGGHQMFDRGKQSMVEAEQLRQIYPGIKFKKVDKQWGIEPVLTGDFFAVKKL